MSRKTQQQASRRWPIWVVPVAIIAFALAVRLIYLWQDTASPFFDHRGIDAKQYHDMAVAVADGSWTSTAPFFWPPLYPLLLSVVYTLFGSTAMAAKVVQVVLGAVGCGIVWDIARRTFGGRFVPAVAAVACSLNGILIYFDAQLLSAGLDVLLQLVVIWLLLIAAQRRHVGWWLVAGVTIGLSAINRGSILLLLPIVLVWVWCIARRNWPTPGSDTTTPTRPIRWPIAIAAIVLPVIIIIAPVAWHNARYDMLSGDADTSASATASRLLTGQSCLIATNGGLNFYLGNHWDLRDIKDTEHPLHFDHYNRIKNEPADKGITSARQQSRYLTRQTLSHIADAPGDWLKLMGVKVAQLLSGSEIPRNANPYADRQYSGLLSLLLWHRVLAIPSGLIVPLGIVGIVLAWPTRRSHALLLAAIAVQAAFILAFFVTARYRITLMGPLIIYAAFAVKVLYDRACAYDKKPLIAPAVLTAILLIVCNVAGGSVGNRHGAQEWYNLADDMTSQGKIDQAIIYLRNALEAQPGHVRAHNNLASALAARQQIPEAILHYRQTIKLDPDYPEAHYNLANLLVITGQHADAVEHYNAMLRMQPDHQPTLNNLAWILATSVDPDVRNGAEAVALAERLCNQTNREDPGALDTLAAAYAETGQFDRAVTTLQEAIRIARTTGDQKAIASYTAKANQYAQRRPYRQQ